MFDLFVVYCSVFGHRICLCFGNLRLPCKFLKRGEWCHRFYDLLVCCSNALLYLYIFSQILPELSTVFLSVLLTKQVINRYCSISMKRPAVSRTFLAQLYKQAHLALVSFRSWTSQKIVKTFGNSIKLQKTLLCVFYCC